MPRRRGGPWVALSGKKTKWTLPYRTMLNWTKIDFNDFLMDFNWCYFFLCVLWMFFDYFLMTLLSLNSYMGFRTHFFRTHNTYMAPSILFWCRKSTAKVHQGNLATCFSKTFNGLSKQGLAEQGCLGVKNTKKRQINTKIVQKGAALRAALFGWFLCVFICLFFVFLTPGILSLPAPACSTH